ncbi:hypothetical protein EDD11_005560 [Mortierella claussenii]|nr:hypothetical protein EDD11_005560 [Mortierella claussenii]
MCILLWTLPNSNHPRFKFAFASNRDEFMARHTSQVDFWDLPRVLKGATESSGQESASSEEATANKIIFNNSNKVGVLSGQDLQPSLAENYAIQETEITADGLERVTLTLSTEHVPGTWLGITTEGDLVALTNYRESMEYMAELRKPKLSRGKICGEYLITMATTHENRLKNNHGQDSTLAKDCAEQWIRKRARGWDAEFEGLNLLVVQNSGDQQCVGGNREGSKLSVFDDAWRKKTEGSFSASLNNDAVPREHAIVPGSVVGISNSVFLRPWTKVESGRKALEKTLNLSIGLFGTGSHASAQGHASVKSMDGDTQELSDDSRELAWLVIEMLTLLRTNTKPYGIHDQKDFLSTVMGLRERVFIPRIGMGGPDLEYGTRSSAVVLFGRESGVGVFVEKVWYGPLDRITGVRQEFSPHTSEGLVWWQGQVGQPQNEWRKVEGQELETLLRHAQEVRNRNTLA